LLLLLLLLLATLLREGRARGGRMEEGWEELPLGVRMVGKPRFFLIFRPVTP